MASFFSLFDLKIYIQNNYLLYKVQFNGLFAYMAWLYQKLPIL